MDDVFAYKLVFNDKDETNVDARVGTIFFK